MRSVLHIGTVLEGGPFVRSESHIGTVLERMSSCEECVTYRNSPREDVQL